MADSEETGNLAAIPGDNTLSFLGQDGTPLSELGISENQSPGIESFSLDIAVDITAPQTNDANITVELAILLSESSNTLSASQIAVGTVSVAPNSNGTLTLDLDIDSDNATDLETLRSGNAILSFTLAISGDDADETATYDLKTLDLAASYTPADALTF